MVQGINNDNINTAGTGIDIESTDIINYDSRFLKCLLSCKNGLQTTIIEELYNSNTNTQVTNIYPVTLTAIYNCTVINVTINGNLIFGDGIYAFIFGCGSNNCSSNIGINKINTLRNCESCITFILVQNPSNECNILSIPGKEWFDITNYIDIMGVLDPLGYYYFNTCDYDNCKEFNISLTIPGSSSSRVNKSVNIYTISTTGYIKIHKCGPNFRVRIYLCKSEVIALYGLDDSGNNTVSPAFITGSCVNITDLSVINNLFY